MRLQGHCTGPILPTWGGMWNPWRLMGCLAVALCMDGCALADMPPPGPPAQGGKTVVFLASDFKNGGVMGVYRGFEEACRKLGWKVQLEDGHGERPTQEAILEKAVQSKPHALVFGGFDPTEFSKQVAHARQERIHLVGWHAAKAPGPTKDLLVNVATDSAQVAKLAADFVIQDGKARKRPVGVVIFNDNQYAVANAKTDMMAKTIAQCAGYGGCKVLAVKNMRISDAAMDMATEVPKLLASYGDAWTYSLAINDVYFDEINFPLRAAHRTDILHVSAGDGSLKALGRIESGASQQVATVAEPLRTQGFQLADELNRAFAAAAPSGYQSSPILVTTPALKSAAGKGIDADSGVESAYLAIWGKH